jgi:poly(hydroxyalkanoate) depolymerase family esterase
MLGRLGLTAARLMARAWVPAVAAARPALLPGRTEEVQRFGANPGGLRMFVHLPPVMPPPGAPLIVVLHGCRQDAVGFAADAGWLALAAEVGAPLVLPEQSIANHRHRCFSWYRPGDVGRGLGEAKSIRQMVSFAVRQFGSDRRRVFIAGLSAGGAMTAAMLAAYPAVFAAGAVVAGMPVGAAANAPMALLRMHRADPSQSRAALVAAVRGRRVSGRWPRLSIWQGGRDHTVDPANAELLAAQWSGLHGLPPEPAAEARPAPGVRRRCWGRASRPAVELWTLDEAGHGFPIEARAEGRAGRWVLDAGLSGTRRIASFWGLLD